MKFFKVLFITIAVAATVLAQGGDNSASPLSIFPDFLNPLSSGGASNPIDGSAQFLNTGVESVGSLLEQIIGSLNSLTDQVQAALAGTPVETISAPVLALAGNLGDAAETAVENAVSGLEGLTNGAASTLDDVLSPLIPPSSS